MYSNKLAIAIQHNGKILRELGDTVFMPFGSEYKILINNLNHLKASVRVFIDGRDTTEGAALILEPKGKLALERFIRGGNMHSGNRFKFIERTEAIEAHRGIGIEDGLVRVEYQFESPVYYSYTPTIGDTHWPVGGGDWPTINPVWSSRGVKGSVGPQGISGHAGVAGSVGYNVGNNVGSANFSQTSAGITAPGSISDQEFTYASHFPLDPQQHVIIMRLTGEVTSANNQRRRVQQPITVKTTQTCTSCGKRNQPASAKFCGRCGTSLELV